MCFYILFVFFFLFCTFVFYFVYSVFLYCFVYYFSFSIYICPFLIFVQVYRLLPLGGNPIAVNKYIISYYIFNSMWIYQLLTYWDKSRWFTVHCNDLYNCLTSSVLYEQCKILHLISYAFQSYSHKTHC